MTITRVLILGMVAAYAITGAVAEARVLSTGILAAGAGDLVSCALANVSSKPRNYTAVQLRNQAGAIINSRGAGTLAASYTTFVGHTASGLEYLRCEFDVMGNKQFRANIYVRESDGTVQGALDAR